MVRFTHAAATNTETSDFIANVDNINDEHARRETGLVGTAMLNSFDADRGGDPANPRDDSPEREERAFNFDREMHALPDARREKIFRIRRQLAEGAYDEEFRLESAVERLLESLA